MDFTLFFLIEFRNYQQQIFQQQQQQQNFQQILAHQQQGVAQRLRLVNQQPQQQSSQQQVNRFYDPKTGIRYHIVVPNTIPDNMKSSYEMHRRLEIEKLQNRKQTEADVSALLNRNTSQGAVRVNYPPFPTGNRFLSGPQACLLYTSPSPRDS